MSKLSTITDYDVMPQVAHRNITSNRERMNKIIHFSSNLIEVLLVCFIFIALYFYRLSEEFGFSLWDTYGLSNTLPRISEYIIFFGITILLWLAWSSHFKLFSFKTDVMVSYFEEVMKCVKSVTYSVLIAIGIAFIFKLEDYSRFVILSFLILSILFQVGFRGIRRLLIYYLARKGLFVRNVLIIGAGKIGVLIGKELQNNSSLGYNIIGYVDDYKNGELGSHRVLGTLDDIRRIIMEHPIDEIIVTIPHEKKVINDFLNKYRKYNFQIRIVPEMFNLVSKTVEVGTIQAIPYITLIKTPMKGLPFLVKRTLDFMLSFTGLIVLAPFLLIVALLIKIDSSGPVFYKQTRVGRDGQFFKMYKFRSMVVNAEELQRKLVQLNEVDGPAFKIKDDPRITKLGRFLRKYSIDELPQLINVLKGEMSLIGPRPPLPNEVEQYSDWEWRRLEVVPGITGLWQVSGRSELSFDQWINLDIYYIENWSLGMDVKILLKTVPVVLKGEGAY